MVDRQLESARAIDEESVCDESMNTSPNRSEEDENTDALSSVSAKGWREALSRSRADRVGTDNKQNEGYARGGGSENTHKEIDSISESDFRVTVAQNEDNNNNNNIVHL